MDEIDSEIVELRRKRPITILNEETDENKENLDETAKSVISKRRSFRNSIRESFRNKPWKSSVKRTQSYSEPIQDRPKVPPRRSKTMRLLKAAVPKPDTTNSNNTSNNIDNNNDEVDNNNTQPPAPLLVADPPSSEDGTDLEDVRFSTDPALLNGRLSLPVQKVLTSGRKYDRSQSIQEWSSGNFGSAGARSAPGTPQGILCTPPGGLPSEPPSSQPCSPGCTSPSIQRSPSHSIFTKCDKASLKHLSTSTPAMTAQAQLTEPPSPKTAKEAKVAKVPTMSKGRQKKFNRHFPSVDDEKVLNYYSCALIGDILLQGHLYITKNYFAFYSNVFGYVTKLLIPMLSVEKISKEKTARIIPNAVGIATSEDKHVFGSLMSRDNTYRYMIKVWEVAQNASTLVVEPEIEPVPSDTDSSGTREGESGRESPAPIPPCLTHPVKLNGNLEPPMSGVKDKAETQHSQEAMGALRQGISKFAGLPRQSLILFATTLLLILLFLSAAVLLYRIGRIQTRYAHDFRDALVPPGDDDYYGHLLQWQSQLHSRSAGAVHDFLDSNLDQIAKVRQSLEALSTLLVPDAGRRREDTSS